MNYARYLPKICLDRLTKKFFPGNSNKILWISHKLQNIWNRIAGQIIKGGMIEDVITYNYIFWSEFIMTMGTTN